MRRCCPNLSDREPDDASDRVGDRRGAEPKEHLAQSGAKCRASGEASYERAEQKERQRTGAARITCHLGAGASLAAVRDGRSIDTTMGFTPLDGLVMATRPGSIDPGLLLWLLEHGDMSELEMAQALEHDAGLTGLAGTDDMREILTRDHADEPQARLALDAYLHRLRAGIAAMAAALGGVETIVFTGGVGSARPPSGPTRSPGSSSSECGSTPPRTRRLKATRR